MSLSNFSRFTIGASLHGCPTAHGPDTEAFEKATNSELKAHKISENALAFMFESTYMLHITDHAQNGNVDQDYWKCWLTLNKHFDDK